jgi:outer membrane protein assembly factor BamB
MRNSISILVLLLSTTLWCVPLAAAGDGAVAESANDWPQWRGVNRDSISPETGLLDRWPEGGPTVLWRIKVGAGFSSVSVSDGKLYTLWDADGRQFLFCLDARTGKELWRRLLGPAFTHHYGDGPRSTPVIDGGTVYAVGTQGRLLAADKDTGEPRWQHNLVQEFGADLPSYGYSASPLVVGDRLFIEAGGKNAAYIAFDKKSGVVAWTSQDDQPAYSSPIHVSIDGVSQIVFWSARGVRAVASESGEVLWRHPWENFCPVTGAPLNTATPIFVAPDRIFLSSGIGAALLRVERKEEGFDIKTVWESQEMRADVNTGLSLDGYIYGFDRSTLKALDVETGEVKWSARGFKRGSLIAADGHLIVLGEDGNLALADAKPDAFTETGKARILEGRNWTTPTLAGGRLYLRNDEELVCLNVGA